jgi:hypothetical protein
MSSDDIETLRAAYEREHELRLQLEDDCDLLALENERLRGELAALLDGKEMIDDTISAATSAAAAASSKDAEGYALVRRDQAPMVDTFVDGDGCFAKSLRLQVADACGGRNAICTTFSHFAESQGTDILICGGVDNCLSGYDGEDGQKLFSYPLSSPVLALDSFGHMVACSMMDGGHAVVSNLTLKVFVLS